MPMEPGRPRPANNRMKLFLRWLLGQSGRRADPNFSFVIFHGEEFYMIQQHDFVQPKRLNFKDDGIFPNSPLPLLFYRQALAPNTEDPASTFEERFAENEWTNSGRKGAHYFLHLITQRH